uniref:Uncharacterized protein n=1 Tax=Candidatus Kentrum sp. DK TaxID=2126562 RepID=A0A450TP51_9GAMM|nr:MAG: hypothetical protein BECKDK2373B_GA0170837_12502 [Candidatus Kentron sp. DK]
MTDPVVCPNNITEYLQKREPIRIIFIDSFPSVAISLPKFLGVSMMCRSKTPVFHGYLARINVNQTTLTCLFGPWNTGISENLGNDMVCRHGK